MSQPFPLLWIPLLPLLGAAFNLTLGHRASRRLVYWVACGSVLGALAVSMVAIFYHLWPLVWTPGALEHNPRLVHTAYEWISAGGLRIDFGLVCDPLTAVMLIVVTFVGFLIHVYSTGYMDHDHDYPRFFGYLNLFTGAMLLLVLGENLPVMFVGWEGVGLCSYLLIGFWYDKDGTQKRGLANASAGRKAFVVNRIGDFAFILGMFVLFSATHTLSFAELPGQVSSLTQKLPVLGMGPFTVASVAALLLFIGATGKSAQIPLFVWLPDAMAGPTPVSALIHAATMVTAGVYMVARLNFLYLLAPWVMGIVALVGAVTALFAASIAFAQNDIKKVLAYSTVSQLGYMFVGVGVGAFSAGIFHLFTHAFFKACLFLCAGAVIHALHEEQDIRRMGGLGRGTLGRRLRVTHWTFFISTWAIAGLPPFSGFFSKDEILWKSLSMGNAAFGATWLPLVLYVLGMAAALSTAFYMFRLYGLTFLGSCRLAPDAQERVHSPSTTMRVPLLVLAAGAAVTGCLGVPQLFGEHVNFFHSWLYPVFADGARLLTHVSGVALVERNHLAHNHTLELGLMGLSIVVAAGSSYVAFAMYHRGPSAAAAAFTRKFGGLYRLVLNKYWIDEIYDLLVVKPYKGLSWVFFKVADRAAIDKACVHGAALAVDVAGRVARSVQNGNVQHYVVALLTGVVFVLYWVSTPPSSFEIRPGAQVSVGQLVTFEARSGAEDHRKLEYRWDFNGDGKWDYPEGDAWSSESVVHHTFDKPSKYRVILRVRDTRWRTSSQRVRNVLVTGEADHHAGKLSLILPVGSNGGAR